MTAQPRRNFLKLALAAGIAPALGLPSAAYATQARTFAPQVSDWQDHGIVTRVNMPGGKPAQIWLPVPALDNDWQRSVSNDFTGNATSARIVTAPGGAAWLYARFEGNGPAQLELTSRVQTRNRIIDWQNPTNPIEDPAVLQAALSPSGMKPLDGIVAQHAAKITAGAASDVDKVRAIYAWIVAHCYRNMDTAGCGPGDAVATLTSAGLGGKCADLNGLFVALARASGVPARDIYGVRVAPSAFGFKQLGANSASLTGAQHCRSEVWLSGFGWVAMDPADVLKVMRAETDTWIKDPADPLVTQVNAALFGNWEGNWVGYNTAEDLRLTDTDQPLPFLMYPQAQIDGQRRDELDAKAFAYQISTL